jgi:HK97 family phage prohead protease
MTDHLLHREFPAELQVRQASDGNRYAEGLCVPYNTPADIIEIREEGPITYREQFAPGAFTRAMRAPNRITLVYGHSDGFGDRLGHLVNLEETPAGLVMRARLDPSRAEQAMDALTSSHSALSVAFASIVPRGGSEQAGSLVTRRSVHLAHIAAVPEGAYSDARLTSVRSEEVDLEPTDAELDEQQEAQRRRELAQWAATVENPWAHLRTGSR